MLWTVVAWLVLILQGALTTGALKGQSTVNVEELSLETHRVIGTALCLLIFVSLWSKRRQTDRLAWVFVAAVLSSGWWAARAFLPTIAAGHGFLAAVTAVALAGASGARDPTRLKSAGVAETRRWIRACVRLALMLMVAQVGLGAALRHGLINFEWHLLLAGFASATLLVPAVTVVNDRAANVATQWAARGAIAAVVAQVALGAAVLVMILVGPPSAAAWLTLTVGHVTVGTLTLLLTARLSRSLRDEPTLVTARRAAEE